MKFNWGYGITIFYISFMAVLLYFVIRSTQYDHSLVVDNYYEKDLDYQNHYNKLINTQKLGQAIFFDYNPADHSFVIHFPEDQEVEGTVQFYRPSNKYKDFKKRIKVNEANQMVIDTKGLDRGKWEIKLDWESDAQPFYKQTLIVL